MNEQQLIELVIKIQLAEGGEEKIDNMIDLFISQVPDPNASDYLFAKKFEHLTPEEVVKKAINYKKIIL